MTGKIERPELIKVRHTNRDTFAIEMVMASAVLVFTLLFCHMAYAETAVVGAAPYMTEAEVAKLRLREANPYVDIIDSLTDEEMRVLKNITWAEANNQSIKGQRAVIEVIFNRMLSDEWPDTLIGVLSQKGQFATWKHRNRVTPDKNQDAALALVYAEAPVLPDTSYVYFDRRGVNGKDHIRIEDHVFGR